MNSKLDPLIEAQRGALVEEFENVLRERGVTQQQVAKRLGKDQSWISRLKSKRPRRAEWGAVEDAVVALVGDNDLTGFLTSIWDSYVLDRKFTAGDLHELAYSFRGTTAEAELAAGTLMADFVPTAHFRAILDGGADLILAPKGAGKTVLYSVLTGQTKWTASIEETVDIIAAFGASHKFDRDELFPTRGLRTSQMPVDVKRLRWSTQWRAFVVTCLGNNLLKRTPLSDEPDWMDGVERVASHLRTLGLLHDHASDVRQTFRRCHSLVNAQSDEDQLGDLVSQLNHVLDLVESALERQDRKMWLAFDQLDEAFSDNRPEEALALRGLLSIVRAMSGRSRVRLIAFLRSDVFERIVLSTEEGEIVNVTHFKTRRIQWEPKSLARLVARRCENSVGLATSLGVADRLAESKVARGLIDQFLLPQRDTRLLPPFWPDENHGTFLWLLLASAFRPKEYNPRNLFDLLKIACERELAAKRDAGSSTPTAMLLSNPSLRTAWIRLSDQRMRDTAQAEWREVGQRAYALKGLPWCFTDDLLAQRFKLAPESDDFIRTRDAIRAAGVIDAVEYEAADWQVTPLYRPRLGVQPPVR